VKHIPSIAFLRTPHAKRHLQPQMKSFTAHLSAIYVGLLGLLVAQCQAQRPGLTGSLGYNFTLAALNVKLPNANATGAPLVLGSGGATSGVYLYVSSTYASYPYNDYPALALDNNGLRAYTTNGQWVTNATEVQSLGKLGWVTTTIYARPAPQVYATTRLPAYQYPLLAAHSFHNLWSLCPTTNSGGQISVVFNVTAEAATQPFLGYDPAGCYSVVLQVVPLPSSGSA